MSEIREFEFCPEARSDDNLGDCPVLEEVGLGLGSIEPALDLDTSGGKSNPPAGTVNGGVSVSVAVAVAAVVVDVDVGVGGFTLSFIFTLSNRCLMTAT